MKTCAERSRSNHHRLGEDDPQPPSPTESKFPEALAKEKRRWTTDNRPRPPKLQRRWDNRQLTTDNRQLTTDNRKLITEKTMKTPSFWRWFIDNEKRLRSINTISAREKNEVLHWLSVNLKYYSCEIGQRLSIPINPDQPARLDFAFSNTQHASTLILHLLETAPDLPNWRFSASTNALAEGEPDYFEKEYCLNGFCSKPSHIKFWGLSINPDTDQFVLGILFDFPIDMYDPDLLREVAAIILIDILGEERYEKHIEDLYIFAEIPKEEELLELKDLKRYLEDY